MAFNVKEYSQNRRKQNKTSTSFNIDLYSKYQNADKVGEDITNRINKWVNNNNNFINNYKNRYKDGSKTYRTDSDDWLNTISSQKSNFDKEAENIRKMLDAYKGVFDSKWVDSIYKALDEGTKIQGDIIKTSTDDKNFWSNFKDEKEFNLWYAKENFIDAYNKNPSSARVPIDYHNNLDAWKKEAGLRKEIETIKNSEDFEEYAQKGASIKNPSYQDAVGLVKVFGYPIGGKQIQNKVTFMQDENNYSMGMDSSLANPNLHFMNEDEVSVYNYYLGKGDNKKAEDFLSSINDDLNKRMGRQLAENAQKLNLEWLMAINTGLDQFASGLGNIDNFIMGSEADPISPIQHAGSFIRENINDDFWRGAWDVGVSISNMLPSILVGSVTGGVGGAVAGNVGGLATMGASVLGNSYAAMRELGYDEWQSRGYAVMVTAAEVALQHAMGGISKLAGGKSLSKIATNAINNVDNGIARVALKLGANMVSEGLEEATQEVLDPIFKYIATLGEEWDGIDWGNVAYSGLLGALSAGALESISGDTIRTDRETTKLGKEIKNAGNEVKLADYVKSNKTIFSADSVAAQIAPKITASTNAYQIGRLYQEAGATLSEQNLTDIRLGLEARHVPTKYAEKLADEYKAFLDGEMKLTDKAVAVLEQCDPLTSAIREKLIDSNLTSYQMMQASVVGRDSDIYQRTRTFTDLLDVANDVSRAKTNASSNDFNFNLPYSSETITNKVAEAQNAAQNTKYRSNQYEYNSNDKTNEIAPKGYKFSHNNSGESVIVDTGDIVSVKGISSIKNGNVFVKTEQGKEINAKDISFGTEKEALLYNMVSNIKNIPTDTAQFMIDTYNKGDQSVSIEDYRADAPLAYKYGTINYTKGLANLNLTEDQKVSLFGRGRQDAMANTATKQANINNLISQPNADAPLDVKKGKVYFDNVDVKTLTTRQKTSIDGLNVVADALGVDIHLFESPVNAEGKHIGANGWYDQKNSSIFVDVHAGATGEGVMLYTGSHELTHFIKQWSPEKYKVFSDFLIEEYGKKGVDVDGLVRDQIRKAKDNHRNIDYDTAFDEVIADACETMLTDSNAIEKLAKLKSKDQSVWEKVKDFIKNLTNRIKAAYKKLNPDSVEANHVRKMVDAAEKLQALWTDALVDAGKAHSNTTDFVQLDMGSESASPMFSERTWTESEYVQAREEAAEKLFNALGVSKKKALAYIDDVNSIARMIADDRVRLDYEASPFGSSFVSNAEYGGSFDFTTLCKKRRIYTGTFSEIQKRLRDVALTPDDILKIRNMLIEKGVDATCGLCYVEGSRANMGKFAKEFIRLYKRDNQSSWIPDMADVNTPDGVESMKINHPEAYEQYEYFWNHYGKLKDSDPALFASQQKPKLYEARKEYKGEILKYFNNDSTVEKKNINGGIRMQSFSDFEIVHMIDTMQIIMDMSTVGLAGQAYTKVVEFAEAFGDTGLKINLSLIAKGVDENGNLIFDDREGMEHNEAFRLRDKYSKNVGTIIVTFTDEQLLAAMSDPRIDFIIPFHRSQWKKGQYEAMGLPKGTKDYTFMQNEKLIKQTYHEYHGKTVKDKASNYMPNEYWDFSKSGKANAEAYLKMCAENNKRPKFYKLLDYDGKGAYSLKKDGSTDGYWKLLIDFKMYDNNGVGSPQNAVTPKFSMDEAIRILDEYRGGHKSYPVANDVVDAFVDEYNDSVLHEGQVLYSDRGVNKYGIEVYETSEETKKLSFKERQNVFLDIMINQYRGRTAKFIRNGHTYYARFEEADVRKNIYGDNRSDYKGIKAKVNVGADGNIFELVENARYDGSKQEKGKITQAHQNVVYWDYFIKTVQIDNKVFDLLANVRKKSDGGYVYSIQLNENKKVEASPSLIPIEGVSNRMLNASTDFTIPQKSDSVKSFSENFQKNSERDPDSVSNRSLLANALESAAQNDIERNKLEQYKQKIDLINSEETKLHELREQIKELSFAKGRRDVEKIKSLQFEANQAANRINTYDRQLLTLEASKPLKAVLEREKQLAYKKAEQRGKDALAAYREKSMQKTQDLKQYYQESREKIFERRHESEFRGKIKNLKERIQKDLLNPSDRRYVPVGLVDTMIDVCNAIDTDTDLYKANGELNKAQAQRNIVKEKLQALKEEYEKLEKNADPMYSGEYDSLVKDALAELRDKFADKSIKEMNLSELEEMYDLLKSIEGSLKDARKLIGENEAGDVYKAGDSIIAEQWKIQKSRKGGKRSQAEILKDNTLNLSLAPMRNVERMTGYNSNSDLLKLFKAFETGVREKNKFSMESYKSFESLTSGENAKVYEDAIYNPYKGIELTDANGKKFNVSKMQMMQAILSYEREIANNKTRHFEGSGLAFADLGQLKKGNLGASISSEYSHKIVNAIEATEKFIKALKNDKWAQDYMNAARKFFDGKAKKAVNDTSLALKHRIIAKDKNYIPFEVDKNFVVREISAQNDIQQTINSYGMLQDVKRGASNPLIITGLNNIIDRHIDQVATIHGLAIPIRNFNKVWNVKHTNEETGASETVQSAIEKVWGKEGKNHITQTVQDLQGNRISTQSTLYKKIKSGYIGATFLLNGSVVMKQIGSMFSAMSMLSNGNPVSMFSNLIHTIKNSKKIAQEVDKYTASVWMRRQGLSDAELHTLMTGKQQFAITKAIKNAPTVINPAKWMTAMDSTVALSLWNYAKKDVQQKTNLQGEALLKETAKHFDEIIEYTQSTTDVLHRPEIQKRDDILSETFGMFKTDLYQMAGNLETAIGRLKASNTKENRKHLAKTVYATFASMMWGQFATTLFALLRYKVKQYRDDETDEITMESWLKRQAFSIMGDLFGYILPIGGAEFADIIENIVYGESDELIDSVAISAINDLYQSISKLGASLASGETLSESDTRKLIAQALQIFGVPANNIIRMFDAIRLHAKDIANGEFLSFNAGVDVSAGKYANRIINAIVNGDLTKAKDILDDAVEDLAFRKSNANGEDVNDEYRSDCMSTIKTAIGKKYKDGDINRETAERLLSEVFGINGDELYWMLDKWDYTKENGTSDGYTKYDDFYEAVSTGKNIKEVIKLYTEKGVSKQTLAAQITNHYKPLYIEMSKAERAKLKGYLLNAYVLLGYKRSEKAKDIDSWIKD